MDSQVENQEGSTATRPADDRPADTFVDHISAEENDRELAFAIAAGDVPADTHAVRDEQVAEGTLSSQTTATGPLSVPSSGMASVLENVTALDGTVDHRGGASAAASTSEGPNVSSEDAEVGLKQTDLKHWLL